MCKHVALMALVLGALVGCPASGPERADLTLEALGERLARSICPGAPTKVEPVPNRHVPGQVDRLETRECATGSSTLYLGNTTSDPNGLALALEIRAQGMELPSHLEIGQSIGKTRRVLGPPQEQTSGSVTYGLGLEGINTITIRHAAGKVSSVQWAWVVD